MVDVFLVFAGAVNTGQEGGFFPCWCGSTLVQDSDTTRPSGPATTGVHMVA